MNWTNCISARRTGSSNKSPEKIRSDYQRDYDRLIFSSAFRRLQNKTQVFPLPGSSTFVHNRLTHSLEVASVGRSLGSVVGSYIADLVDDEDIKNFYEYELKSVIGAGCLAHDVGNPAYGHSGENAISNYFIQNKETTIEGESLQSFFSKSEWEDITNFEGNANALRILTHQFNGKQEGGLGLTYITLASILKYPCESIAVSKGQKHTKKYGFFQSEREIFESIVTDTGMHHESSSPTVFKRHPYVYLVEAADDICYRIIDMEDAHRLGILSRGTVENALMDVIRETKREDIDLGKIHRTLTTVTDDNESIAYLRAKCINALVMESADVFKANQSAIIDGQYTSTLMDDVESKCTSLKAIEKISIDKIYNHNSVIRVELAGYKVMSGLLEIFVPAILASKPSAIDRKSLVLIPNQFKPHDSSSPYDKVMSVLDYISGMTDDYAIALYRNIMGIEIAGH